MARPKEFDQDKALRCAVLLFSQQGFAATSTDELMRVMEIGRQSMYDTFGDKRGLFLKVLEMYVTESVQSINAQLEKRGPALAAIRKTLIAFAERSDLSSTEGCMGLNAVSEFAEYGNFCGKSLPRIRIGRPLRAREFVRTNRFNLGILSMLFADPTTAHRCKGPDDVVCAWDKGITIPLRCYANSVVALRLLGSLLQKWIQSAKRSMGARYSCGWT
jgi:AcrR family transcriptional regulator